MLNFIHSWFHLRLTTKDQALILVFVRELKTFKGNSKLYSCFRSNQFECSSIHPLSLVEYENIRNELFVRVLDTAGNKNKCYIWQPQSPRDCHTDLLDFVCPFELKSVEVALTK